MPPSTLSSTTLNLLRRSLWFGRALIARAARDHAFQLAASLAYTTLLAIVPLVVVGLGIFTAFPQFAEFTEAIQQFVGKNLLPPTVAQRVLDSVDSFARNAAQLTTVGIFSFGLTAFLLMATIERAFNAIWHSRRSRPVALRVLMYWGVMTLGPVVVGASLTLTSHASFAFGSWLAPRVSAAGAHWFPGTVAVALPFVLTAASLTLLYMVAPARSVRWQHALLGGVVAAVAFEIMKRAFGQYLTHGAAFTSVYGTLAAVPIFLVWIYLSWVVVILAAEIVAQAPDWATVASAKSPVVSATDRPGFQELLVLLRDLIIAQNDSRTASVTGLARLAQLPMESTEQALETLAELGYATAVSDSEWALICDPDRVTVAQVYRGFRRSLAPRRALNESVSLAVSDLEGAVSTALDRPLRALVSDLA